MLDLPPYYLVNSIILVYKCDHIFDVLVSGLSVRFFTNLNENDWNKKSDPELSKAKLIANTNYRSFGILSLCGNKNVVSESHY